MGEGGESGEATRPLGGIGEAFADRNFRLYSVGAVVSWVSFFVQAIAVSWTTWALTGSTAWLATIAVLDVAPALVLLPLGGVLADRHDRVVIVIITSSLALCQSAALAILAVLGRLDIAALAVLALAHGAIHSFSVPAFYGMVPRFVAPHRLASAIAVSASYTQLAIFAGPALAGWILLHYGAAAAFATNVLGYAIYLASVVAMRTPPTYKRPPPTGKTVIGDLGAGVAYIGGHRGIKALLLLMLMGDAMSSSVYQMLPAYADRTLGMGVDGVATLLAAAGAGATAAALWLAHGGARRVSPDRVLWAFLGFVGAVAFLMLIDDVILAVGAMLIYGMTGEIRRTGTVSLLQTAVPDDQRGRVMSTQFLLHRLAGGAGTVLIGFAADEVGLRPPMLVAAGLALIAWALAFVARRRIDAAFRTG